jgi:hypothetical protein
MRPALRRVATLVGLLSAAVVLAVVMLAGTSYVLLMLLLHAFSP